MAGIRPFSLLSLKNAHVEKKNHVFLEIFTCPEKEHRYIFHISNYVFYYESNQAHKLLHFCSFGAWKNEMITNLQSVELQRLGLE